MQAPPASCADVAWQIKQKHRFYGDLILKLCKGGMSIDQTRFFTTFVRKSGDDNYFVFSKTNNVFFNGHGNSASEMARVEFVAGISTHEKDCVDWSGVGWKKAKTGVICGLPAQTIPGGAIEKALGNLGDTGTRHAPVDDR